MTDVFTSTATIVNPQMTSAVHDLLLTAMQAGLVALVTGGTWLVKLGINSMKSGWKQTVAARLVAFASQRFVPNEEKRAYVARKLHEHFPRLSQEEIEHLLEEAVVNLKSGLEPL